MLLSVNVNQYRCGQQQLIGHQVGQRGNSVLVSQAFAWLQTETDTLKGQGQQMSHHVRNFMQTRRLLPVPVCRICSSSCNLSSCHMRPMCGLLRFTWGNCHWFAGWRAPQRGSLAPGPPLAPSHAIAQRLAAAAAASQGGSTPLGGKHGRVRPISAKDVPGSATAESRQARVLSQSAGRLFFKVMNLAPDPEIKHLEIPYLITPALSPHLCTVPHPSYPLLASPFFTPPTLSCVCAPSFPHLTLSLCLHTSPHLLPSLCVCSTRACRSQQASFPPPVPVHRPCSLGGTTGPGAGRSLAFTLRRFVHSLFHRVKWYRNTYISSLTKTFTLKAALKEQSVFSFWIVTVGVGGHSPSEEYTQENGRSRSSITCYCTNINPQVNCKEDRIVRR